jgi:hypothetical protein
VVDLLTKKGNYAFGTWVGGQELPDFANRSWRSFGSLIRPGSFSESKASDVSKKIPGTAMAWATALKKCHASVDFGAFGSTSQ